MPRVCPAINRARKEVAWRCVRKPELKLRGRNAKLGVTDCSVRIHPENVKNLNYWVVILT
jgi:hypothetical protein